MCQDVNFFILMGHLTEWEVSLLKDVLKKYSEDEQKVVFCVTLPFPTLQEHIRVVHQTPALAAARQLERHQMPSGGCGGSALSFNEPGGRLLQALERPF